jgi:hypothetical protein
MALLLTLADALTFVGFAGAVLAVVSALIASVAFAVPEASTGGKVASVMWLGAAVMSLCSSFTGAWLWPVVAVAAPIVFWILMQAFRVLGTATENAPKPEEDS